MRLSALPVFWLAISYAQAQAINPDLVVWSTISQWGDLRACLQFCFTGGVFDSSIHGAVGCTTNACLCRADTLGNAEVILASEALSRCSDFQDQCTATSILLSY